MVGRGDVQRRHVALVAAGLVFAEGAPVYAVAARALEDRIVDVGHVLNVGDLMSQPAQGADEHVELDEGEGVAEVGGVVWRDAADVERDRIGR